MEIPFECTYPNQAEASLVQMNITNANIIFLAPDEGSGIFDLDLSIYKVLSTGKGRIWNRNDSSVVSEDKKAHSRFLSADVVE